MHACGHDAHAAMGYAAAVLLEREKREFSGTVRMIFQPAERAEPLGGRRVGEPHVADATMGYLNNPAASEQLWAGGYMHTGDMGSINPEGTLHITDRLKDIMKSGGEWLSSIDLEDIILQKEGVVKAAVIAVRDDKWGERPLALANVQPSSR
jgi:fatty-acyl-CoA synthase